MKGQSVPGSLHDVKRDRLYRESDGPHPFAFDERVAAVFPDMIRRSVPGYATTLALTSLVAERHARAGTRLYDLGCALGESARAMAARVRLADVEIIAVDAAWPMIRLARRRPVEKAEPPIRWLCADVDAVRIRHASVVALNYTLQFIAPPRREALLARVRSGLCPGGVLILAEKVAPEEDAPWWNDLHARWKRAQGYSEGEVARKRAALESVLQPDTLETHHRRLRKAGFSRVRVLASCLQFVTLLAET